jgi:hypothetical protein
MHFFPEMEEGRLPYSYNCYIDKSNQNKDDITANEMRFNIYVSLAMVPHELLMKTKHNLHVGIL